MPRAFKLDAYVRHRHGGPIMRVMTADKKWPGQVVCSRVAEMAGGRQLLIFAGFQPDELELIDESGARSTRMTKFYTRAIAPH